MAGCLWYFWCNCPFICQAIANKSDGTKNGALLEQSVQSIDPLYEQANNLLDKGQIKEAIDILNPLVKNNPNNFAYVHDLAVAFEEGGETDTALEYFQKAEKLQPNNATCHYLWDAYIS